MASATQQPPSASSSNSRVSTVLLRPRQIDFAQYWNPLKETIEKILFLKPVPHLTWDYSFGDIYFLCVSVPEGYSRRLYLAVENCLKDHVTKLKNELELFISSDELIKQYNTEWETYRTAANSIQNLFGYLNRQLVKEKHDTETQYAFPDDPPIDYFHRGIGELALDIWKLEMMAPLCEHLITTVIRMIERERSGIPSFDTMSIRQTVLSFVDVSTPFSDTSTILGYRSAFLNSSNSSITEFYEETFERQFLDSTANYYRSLIQGQFALFDCSNYMSNVILKMNEERGRCARLLHQSTMPKVEKLCSELFVASELPRITTFCHQTIQQEFLDDLRNMHILLRPIPNGISVLITEFELWVKRCCMDLMVLTGVGTNGGGTMDAAQFVIGTDALHEKLLKMVGRTFKGDADFTAALDRGLQSVINHREDPKQPPKISERLNRYIDSLLRAKKIASNSGLTQRSDSELEVLMNKSIVIFRYIDDKDLFQKFYAKMLCNRLIVGFSSSMALEELMIGKMKETCGFEYTNKFSRMYTDIGLSENLTKEFNEEMTKNNIRLPVATTVMVLQAGAWPLSSPSVPLPIPGNTTIGGILSTSASGGTGEPMDTSGTGGSGTQNLSVSIPNGYYTPPASLLDTIQRFEEFYTGRHNGRKLAWLYNQSLAEVQLNYLDRQYILTLNIYQLSLLLEFSKKDKNRVSDLVSSCVIPVGTAVKCLRGLVDLAVLTSNDEVLRLESALSLNSSFASKRLHIKVALFPTSASNANSKFGSSSKRNNSHQRLQQQEPNNSSLGGGGSCADDESSMMLMESSSFTGQFDESSAPGPSSTFYAGSLQQDRKYYMECIIVRIMKARKVMKHDALVSEIMEQSKNKFIPDIQFIKRNIESLIEKMYIQRRHEQHDEYEYIS